MVMEQPFSSSQVSVEYFDPYDVYKLLAPGLIPRLPLRDLHWQSHNGPLRSINTLHVEIVPTGTDTSVIASVSPQKEERKIREDSQTSLGKRARSVDRQAGSRSVLPGKERRHQIPGLRRTPYLKVLLVRCDDNETYRSTTRGEVREWVKAYTPPSQRKSSTQEKHDAFEWLIVHVVIPNTVAATQARLSGRTLDAADGKTTSLWRAGSSTLLEKLRSDFSPGKLDRVAQIRIGVNDVPYDMLPRVVPAVPTGYHETEQDSEVAWADLIGKFKSLILASFDMRVSQYEEDIKEKDGQRKLPGWNFCTFFILKEGLAQGFESVGLVEDALVGYDELSLGLDSIIQEQVPGDVPGGLLTFTPELKKVAERAMKRTGSVEVEESREETSAEVDELDEIPISSAKKSYRELIVANQVSAFDFRCYVFARQISLLLRLGNAWSTREELLAKVKEQQDSVLTGIAPRTLPPKQTDEPENLSMLADLCRRALGFIPMVATVIRQDVLSALSCQGVASSTLLEVVDNMSASFAFSVAQQVLAHTSTKALPIPPSSLAPSEDKLSIPEPRTTTHPARSTSLVMRHSNPSPTLFPGPGRTSTLGETAHASFLKVGLEELAARRAELYTLSRNILEECGKKRGWSGGWSGGASGGGQHVTVVGDGGTGELENVCLDDNPDRNRKEKASLAGIDNRLLRAALSKREDFYRLYETLTDKCLRHYTVANQQNAVQANLADLAVLSLQLEDYKAAASYFYRTIPFYGESGWSLLELSMLVMYARCLKELRRMDDYMNKAILKLLSKAAAAELERVGLQPCREKCFPDRSVISGFLQELLTLSDSLGKELRVSLASFFCEAELDGSPSYDNGQDSFSIGLKMRSLFVDDFTVERVRVRIVSAIAGRMEIWLQNRAAVVIRPGKNRIELASKTIMSGKYEVDQIFLCSNKVSFHYERDMTLPLDRSSLLQCPHLTLFRRASSLDVVLSAQKEVHLDGNKSLDLEIRTGWNEIRSCEAKIEPATAGLRLLMSEAQVLGDVQPCGKTEDGGGSFAFANMATDTSVRLRFPFTMEQDHYTVAVRVELTYSTDRGDFVLSKIASVPVGLALAVNVQDVFKHDALFSRFTVSTASRKPLRLLKCELEDSEVLQSHFGLPPSRPTLIFAKQPATLLYKITRKPDVRVRADSKKTMRLKLHYSTLSDEIECLVGRSLREAMRGTHLWEYSELVIGHVLGMMPDMLSAYELEKAAILGELSMSFLREVGEAEWEKHFPGFALTADRSTVESLIGLIQDWVRRNPILTVAPPEDEDELKTVIIPVDIPAVAIVHTADIRFQHLPVAKADLDEPGYYPAVCLNHLLPARLQLKWTRIWDTGDETSRELSAVDTDLEFGFEVTAPADTWLIGGRSRGHFIIPAGELASVSTSEPDIPLVLVPLREGWLPFPVVEIREVKSAADDGAATRDHRRCEIDQRNVGETVRVVHDRARVTLSLDASGPGGGPLVLESERLSRGKGIESLLP